MSTTTISHGWSTILGYGYNGHALTESVFVNLGNNLHL